jgi:predicted HAD superfamily Cof-like phosphohydrolase
MAFRFNPFTGNLDIIGGAAISTGNFVTYVGATSDVNLGNFSLSANVITGAVTANTLTVDSLAGPLLAENGFVSAAATGNLNVTAPVLIDNARQLLGGAATISLDTANIQAVVTSGAISVTSPLTTDNLAFAIGSALHIGINTSNLQAVVTSGVVSAVSPLGTNNLAFVLGNSLELSIDTSNLQAVVTSGAISAVSPLTTDNLAFAIGGAIALGIDTSNIQAVVTSGAVTVLSPLTTDNLAFTLGSAIQIGIDTSNLQAVITTGAINCISPLQTSNLAFAVGGTLNLSIDTSNLQAVITTGAISVSSPLQTSNLAFAVGGTLNISVDTANFLGQAYFSSFTSANVAGGSINVVHNLGNQYVVPVVYDSANAVVIPDYFLAVTTVNMAVGISSYGTIAGTWRYALLAVGAANTNPQAKIQDSAATTYVDTASSANTILFAANGTVSAYVTSTDIYSVPWTDYSEVSTITGFATFTTKQIYYKKIGKLFVFDFELGGTSNSNQTRFSLPSPPLLDFGFSQSYTRDSGTAQTSLGRGVYSSANAAILCFKDGASASWTNTGTKTTRGQFFYETA